MVVSSTTSCSRLAAMDAGSISRSARIVATSRGWEMNVSPLARVCPPWADFANVYTSSSHVASRVGWYVFTFSSRSENFAAMAFGFLLFDDDGNPSPAPSSDGLEPAYVQPFMVKSTTPESGWMVSGLATWPPSISRYDAFGKSTVYGV